MLLLKSPGSGASTERQACVCDGESFEMVWAGVEEGLRPGPFRMFLQCPEECWSSKLGWKR